MEEEPSTRDTSAGCLRGQKFSRNPGSPQSIAPRRPVADMRTAYVTLSATGRLGALDWGEPGLKLNF